MDKFLAVLILILLNSFTLISQQSYNMRLLANLNGHFNDGFYSAVWGYTAPDGSEYAILGCNAGTSFIDISDTNNIREVDYVAALHSCCREMKTYSHYAYIVGDQTPNGVQIVDLQYLPDSVSLVNTFFFRGLLQVIRYRSRVPRSPFYTSVQGII